MMDKTCDVFFVVHDPAGNLFDFCDLPPGHAGEHRNIRAELDTNKGASVDLFDTWRPNRNIWREGDEWCEHYLDHSPPRSP